MDSMSSLSTPEKKKQFRFEWLIPAIISPKQTFSKIVEDEKPVWLTPLLVLSFLILIAGLVAGPIRRDAIVNGTSLPADFQYYSSDQQAQYLSAQASRSSALFTFIFPIVGSLLGIWISWFLLSSVLHLGLTLAGSRTQSKHTYNLVAWSMLPLGVRQIVQIIAMIIGHSIISAPGLSGFVTGTGGIAYLAGILGQIDIYFIWQIWLLSMGVLPLSNLSKTKTWIVTGCSVLLLVLLAAIPTLASSMLSGLSFGGLI